MDEPRRQKPPSAEWIDLVQSAIWLAVTAASRSGVNDHVRYVGEHLLKQVRPGAVSTSLPDEDEGPDLPQDLMSSRSDTGSAFSMDHTDPEITFDLARYTGIGSILAALRTGHIRLVRLSWLVSLAKTEVAVVRRRQELPEEAFISPSELEEVAASPGFLNDRDNVLPIIAISHCWCTPSHPDPLGVQLKVVAAALERENEKYSEFFSEMGVFWDWTALYQKEDSHSFLTADENNGYTFALLQTMVSAAPLYPLHQPRPIPSSHPLVSPPSSPP